MRVARLAFALLLGLGLGAGCGESTSATGARTPTTAGERARAEQAAGDDDQVSAKDKRWGGWRYQGRRDDCFFLVKRRCYDKRAEACAAARCGKKQCAIEGGGPATVRCE